MEQKVCFDDLPLSEALVMFVQDVSISSRQFPDEIPPVIVQMLQEIGQSGMTDTDWTLLMPVIATMIHQECYNFYHQNGFVGPLPQSFAGRYSTLLGLLAAYSRPPWTIQRLVELLLDPRRNYSSTHKFMNSIEKMLSVTTTLDQYEY